MFNLNYFELCRLVKKGVPLYIYSCGDKYDLFIGDGDMLYYKNRHNGYTCKLNMNDQHQIGVH